MGSAQITGVIYGGGAQSNYGATTIRGDKNNWSGINFRQANGTNAGTLMMYPSYSGFYGANDANWRMLVTEGDNRGGVAGWGTGNVYANDYYIGSTGKWASAAGGGGLGCTEVNTGGWVSSGTATCPIGYTFTGGSCDMYRGGDGREVGPRFCQKSGNGMYCNEGNSGFCVAHAYCCK